MMKEVGYILFSIIYQMCKLFPVNPKKVLCIMTHDDGPGSNVAILQRELKKNEAFSFAYITKTEKESLSGAKKLLSLCAYFFHKPYDLATSGIVLMDNIFLPMAYIKRRPGVKVFQLWHGTGTIKKFGQDATKGKLHKLEYRANQFMTHLIVNSEAMITLYAGAFGVDIDRVYPVGLPKTDEMMKKASSKEETNRIRNKVYEMYHMDRDTKLILYAPTFRDDEVQNPKQISHIKELVNKLPREYSLGVRLHPHVARAYHKELPKGIINLSFYPDINELLLASDILITDYSSIIFEYCILRRKMLFYAYDLESFEKTGRGFYQPYSRYVPGNVITDCDNLLINILDPTIDVDKIDEFVLKSYSYMDKNAVKRICDLIYKD